MSRLTSAIELKLSAVVSGRKIDETRAALVAAARTALGFSDVRWADDPEAVCCRGLTDDGDRVLWTFEMEALHNKRRHYALCELTISAKRPSAEQIKYSIAQGGKKLRATLEQLATDES